MIDKQIVHDIVAEALQGSDCFIVDVMVRPGNNIVVEIDNEEGIDIERCETLHRYIESKLDRDVEDYELEVGSAGITSPFKVVAQYRKNIGNEVEVLSCDGRKLSGVLKSCDENAFTLTITKKVKPEGSKRKIEVEEDILFAYNEVKYTKYLIRFK
ncbi:MAG: ribosome assembly cofactor RimP [Muribaculaceae bacterium]|nr:ribosome assembly cofactor RimP [Muribaculaceae bacterium]